MKVLNSANRRLRPQSLALRRRSSVVRCYRSTVRPDSRGQARRVDPVEGGSANDYDYVYGDPINNYDLDGRVCGRRGWKGWTRRCDWGTVLAGATNVVWGLQKIRIGFAAGLAIPETGPFAWGTLIYAVYHVGTGTGKTARGINQLRGSHRCRSNCDFHGNMHRWFKGVMPTFTGPWIDRIGGLP